MLNQLKTHENCFSILASRHFLPFFWRGVISLFLCKFREVLVKILNIYLLREIRSAVTMCYKCSMRWNIPVFYRFSA